MKRHRLDAVSLVFGAVFLVFGGLHLTGLLDASLLRFKWVAAVAFILLGLGLLLSGRRGEPEN